MSGVRRLEMLSDVQRKALILNPPPTIKKAVRWTALLCLVAGVGFERCFQGVDIKIKII